MMIHYFGMIWRRVFDDLCRRFGDDVGTILGRVVDDDLMIVGRVRNDLGTISG